MKSLVSQSPRSGRYYINNDQPEQLIQQYALDSERPWVCLDGAIEGYRDRIAPLTKSGDLGQLLKFTEAGEERIQLACVRLVNEKMDDLGKYARGEMVGYPGYHTMKARKAIALAEENGAGHLVAGYKQSLPLLAEDAWHRCISERVVRALGFIIGGNEQQASFAMYEVESAIAGALEDGVASAAMRKNDLHNLVRNYEHRFGKPYAYVIREKRGQNDTEAVAQAPTAEVAQPESLTVQPEVQDEPRSGHTSLPNTEPPVRGTGSQLRSLLNRSSIADRRIAA